MRLSNEEKLEKIKRERQNLLSLIRNDIKAKEMAYETEMDHIMFLLKMDEEATKEYETIQKAKQMIAELTEKVSIATTKEEVIEIRKSLNYYINKIKGILKKRGLDKDSKELLSYQEKAQDIRKNIAKYIRFLKRESNILEIERLQLKAKELSQEEYKEYLKLLKNELQYIRRGIKEREKMPHGSLVVVEKKEKKEEEKASSKENPTTLSRKDILEEIGEKFEVIQQEKAAREEDIKNIEKSRFPFGRVERELLSTEEMGTRLAEAMKEKFGEKKQQEEARRKPLTLPKSEKSKKPMITFEEYLKDQTIYYNEKYPLASTLSYEGSFPKRLLAFFRNLPRYHHNKKVLHDIERDFHMFYSGLDLEGFMQYTRKRNSILTGLDMLFRGHSLEERERKCLNMHEYCFDWIKDYYIHNSKIMSAPQCVYKVQ